MVLDYNSNRVRHVLVFLSPTILCPTCLQKMVKRTLCTEELSRDVEGLGSDNNDLLTFEELLSNCAGQATKEMTLAIDGDLYESRTISNQVISMHLLRFCPQNSSNKCAAILFSSPACSIHTALSKLNLPKFFFARQKEVKTHDWLKGRHCVQVFHEEPNKDCRSFCRILYLRDGGGTMGIGGGCRGSS